MSVSEVRAALLPEHVVAYTTVMTVLVRLAQKGRVERAKHGRAYRYTPVEPRADYEARRMAEILHAVDDRSLTLARFVESLDQGELRSLRKAIGDQ